MTQIDFRPRWNESTMCLWRRRYHLNYTSTTSAYLGSKPCISAFVPTETRAGLTMQNNEHGARHIVLLSVSSPKAPLIGLIIVILCHLRQTELLRTRNTRISGDRKNTIFLALSQTFHNGPSSTMRGLQSLPLSDASSKTFIFETKIQIRHHD